MEPYKIVADLPASAPPAGRATTPFAVEVLFA